MTIILVLAFLYAFYTSYKVLSLLDVSRQLQVDIERLQLDNKTLSEIQEEQLDRIYSLLEDQDNSISLEAHERLVAQARESSVKTSRSVNKGLVLEELAPHFQGDYDPKDFKHMGSPLDYLVIDGANDFLEGRSKDIKGIVLYEVKTGNSSLSKIQLLIRKAVQEGRFKFVVSNIDSGKSKATEGKPPEQKEELDEQGIRET